MPETNYRALCVELLQFGDQAGEIAAMEGLWPDCDPGPDSLLDRARAALAQPEPEGPVKYNEDFWRKDALEKLVYAATAFRLGIYSAEELEIAENRARFFLARWGRPAIEPVPVSGRFEFSVFDSEYEEQAGGTAPTYSQALSEGQHYLAMYSQDGPHSLGIRRVEVLPPPRPATTPATLLEISTNGRNIH
jgi:hypothetical protein